MTAAEHAAEAERLLGELTEHLAKRGRKTGLEEGAKASLATAHATMALYRQGVPSEG